MLQQIVDDKRYVQLWSNATLGLQWFSTQYRAIFERSVTSFPPPSLWNVIMRNGLFLSCRAARCGNFESLIKLAVAFLYSEGGKPPPPPPFPTSMYQYHSHQYRTVLAKGRRLPLTECAPRSTCARRSCTLRTSSRSRGS